MLTEFRVTMKKDGIAKQFALSESLHSIKRLKNTKKISREDIFHFEYSNLKMHAPNVPMLSIREIGERYRSIRVVTLVIKIKRIVRMDDLQPEPRSRNGRDFVA